MTEEKELNKNIVCNEPLRLQDKIVMGYINDINDKIKSIKLDMQILEKEKIDKIEIIARQEMKKLNRFCWFASALAIIYTIKLFIGG